MILRKALDRFCLLLICRFFPFRSMVVSKSGLLEFGLGVSFFIATEEVAILCKIHLSWFAGGVRCVEGEGMPMHLNPFEKGDLFVTFDLIFPEHVDIDVIKVSVSYDKLGSFHLAV